MYILCNFWSAEMIAALVAKKKENNTVSYPKLFFLATDRDMCKLQKRTDKRYCNLEKNCPFSVLTGVRMRRVIFRENLSTFCRDTRDCLLYPGVRRALFHCTLPFSYF